MEYDYEYDEVNGEEYQPLYSEEPAQPEPSEEPSRTRRQYRGQDSSGVSMSNVIGMPGVSTNIAEVVIMEPRSFEEMPQAIQILRDRKSLLLNLTTMDPDQAQRAVDFVAGGTYAMDGHQERVGESIFLFTPNCVQVTTTQPGSLYETTQPSSVRSIRTPNTPPPAWTTPDTMRIAQ